MITGVGSMYGLVAARAPTSASHQKAGVVPGPHPTGIDLASGGRRLEVAAQAEVPITGDEHLLINRAVRIMAGGAAFAHRAMLEHEWPLLLGVAVRAILVLSRERKSALYAISAMNIVAVHAADMAGHHRMAIGETEFAALIKMALEAGSGIRLGIDDRPALAAGLHVKAAGTMTRFAARIADLRVRNRQLGVTR